MSKQRVLSGMRPSGKLHLGNLVGALDNWRKLQDEYDCFFFVADWHALTTEYGNPEIIPESIRRRRPSPLLRQRLSLDPIGTRPRPGPAAVDPKPVTLKPQPMGV